MNILEKLHPILQEKNKRLLFACESGSRAWGVNSEDSDYDIRFIYLSHELDYLNIIDPKKDTINFMSPDRQYDFAGWDVKKALALAYKSNASILEWLRSPIIYYSNDKFTKSLEEIMKTFNAKAYMFHHYGLAKQGYSHNKSNYKQYIYTLRSLLTIDYMLRYNHKLPPINFWELVKVSDISPRILMEITDLITIRRNSPEKAKAVELPILNEYIEDELDIIKDTLSATKDTTNPDKDALNELFLRLFKDS
tara:strand:+ start:1690 stop:2442 length:753 start_codon:yes stop_codon:yes gene_type:complete